MNLAKRKNGSSSRSLISQLFSNTGLFLNDIESDLLDGGLKVPLANVSETKNEFKVEISAPGLKKEDFKVEIEDGALVVSSEKEEEKEENKKNYKHQEFSYTSFARSFQLPENAAEDKINARYDDGMLQISIPKKENNTSNSKKAIKVA